MGRGSDGTRWEGSGKPPPASPPEWLAGSPQAHLGKASEGTGMEKSISVLLLMFPLGFLAVPIVVTVATKTGLWEITPRVSFAWPEHQLWNFRVAGVAAVRFVSSKLTDRNIYIDMCIHA